MITATHTTPASCPMDTPWGRAEHTEEVGPGLWAVSTASHGGYYVTPHQLHHVPVIYKNYADRWSHGFGPCWYEEDCAAAAIVVSFPQCFPAEAAIEAQRVLTALREAGKL